MDIKTRVFYSRDDSWDNYKRWLTDNNSAVDIVTIIDGYYDKHTMKREIYYKEKK